MIGPGVVFRLVERGHTWRLSSWDLATSRGEGETHAQMGDGSSAIPVIVVVLVSLLGLQGEAVLREVDRHDDCRHAIG